MSQPRVVPSRYLNASTSLSNKSPAANKSSANPLKPSSATRVATVESRPTQKRRTAPSSSRTAVKSSETAKGKLPVTNSASISNSVPRDEATTLPSKQEKASSILDALQLAAQMQSWLYMTTTLEQQLETSKQSAQRALETRSSELSAEEMDIANERIRFDAERLLDFYEELADPALSSTVPTLVQAFLQCEDTYSRITSEVLQLVPQPLHGRLDVRLFNELLERIATLQHEYRDLESSILKVPSSSTVRDQASVVPLLQSLVRVLRAHCCNMDRLQALVQCSKESLRMSLQMESMRLADH